jgi:uncharacterized protein (DUF427 family)
VIGGYVGGGTVPVRTESIDKWVRGYVGEVAVVDSRAPLLFYEEVFPVPGYAFAEDDVRTDLLRPSTAEPPTEPHFFLPKGPVGQWYDLVVDGRVIPHAAWTREAPELAGRIILSWQPGVLDRWLEESEEVGSHPRDPHKRVEALSSSRHIEVAVNGVVLADSTNPVLLFETDLPTRYYLPAEDVNFAALTESSNRSMCPYKGVADRYWDAEGDEPVANVAWSYAQPFAAVEKIKDRVAFYNELVDITVDGVPQPRPVSIFSDNQNRPGS